MGPTYRHGTGQNSTSTSNRTRRVIPMLDWSCNTITNACFCSLDRSRNESSQLMDRQTRTDLLQSETQTSSSSSQCQRSVFISTRAGSVSPAQHYLLMRLLMLLLLPLSCSTVCRLMGGRKKGRNTAHCRCNT